MAPSAWHARFVAFSLAAILLLPAAPAAAAQDADLHEFWPELNGFFVLQDRARVHLAAAYAKGKESPSRALDLAGYLDVSLYPILRPVRRQQDWARNRYLWTRLGYTHVAKGSDGVQAPSEHRGVAALYWKEELPAGVWTELRARTDLRWISGEYSTRYRFRGELNREFSVRQHPVTPYLQAEWFYDTRYEDWARTLLQLGGEITFSPHFRGEVYVARQKDWVPSPATLDAVGLVAKFYY